MRWLASVAAGFAAVGLFVFSAAPARADDIELGMPVMVSNYQFGDVVSNRVPTPGSRYSNVDTFTGFGITSGGAVVASGNGNLLTTNILMDDLNAGTGNFDMPANWQFTFTTANFNSGTISVRTRVRQAPRARADEHSTRTRAESGSPSAIA